jgi:hypothetical protein
VLWLRGAGVRPSGIPGFLATDVVTLDCQNTRVSGEGDALTIHWRMRAEQCFVDGCGWNCAFEHVEDRAGLRTPSWSDGGGWFRHVGRQTAPNALSSNTRRVNVLTFPCGVP